MSAISGLTTIYFIGSAIRVQRNLSDDITDDAANQASLRRLVRRVFARGCLMIVATVTIAFGSTFAVHPVGFVIGFMLLYSAMIANSMLLIVSFAPAARAPIGPLQKTTIIITLTIRDLGDRAESWLASSSSLKPTLLVRVAKARQERRSSRVDELGFHMLISWMEATQLSRLDRRRPSISNSPSFFNATRAGGADKLKPWERPGVSVRFLDAFVRTHNIKPGMTTTEVMELMIKPETAARKCCYVERLASDDRCPQSWLGKTTHFASHW